MRGVHIGISSKPVVTHRYDIRLLDTFQWGVFIWDSEERLICYTSWGTWGHRWDGNGSQWNAAFLERLNHGYLADKLAPGQSEFYDSETREKLRALAKKTARKQDVRGRAAFIEEVSDVESEGGAYDWGHRWDIPADDVAECITTGPPRGLMAMLEALWAPFVQMVREGQFTLLGASGGVSGSGGLNAETETLAGPQGENHG